MQFDIQKSIQLLSPEYFKDSYTKNNCQFLESVFNDSNHNFIIPSSDFSQADAENNQELLEEYSQKGYEFSYYIPSNLDDQLSPLVKNIGAKYDFTTRYTYKEIGQKYEVPDHEVVSMSKDNFKGFLNAAALCFPGWNNEGFTRWCLDCPYVGMLAVLIDGEIAAFAGYLSKPDQDYVLLMNAGTVPKFRRRGLHEYMIKRRVNQVLDNRASAVFYADVDDGGASHKGFVELGFDGGPLFVGYCETINTPC